jgi:UDP:flavonoid glycosyltransferase YjiC (YdhE family)
VAIVLSPEEATPERIRSAVLSILTEPRFRERALHYKSLFARVDGFELTASLLEKLASARHPLYRTETPIASC